MGAKAPHHPRYEILKQLGRGGTSSVYLARDRLDDGRKVALKVCRFEVTTDQMLREFRVLRELRHPSIARSLDFGRLPDSGSAYFTLDYVPGPTLEMESRSLRQKRRGGDPGPLLDVFLEVLSALGYLHDKGLLHLDLKPANIVVSGGRAKLIDFDLFENVRFQGWRPGRGTAHFMAPELLDGGPIDRRTDLYALGVTLYRAFTGQYPFAGKTIGRIAEAHRRALPRPPRGLPEGLSRIILKLLAKSPRHRFQGAREVWEALRSLTPRLETALPVTPDEPGFTGRKLELDAFFTWLEGLKRGSAHRMLVFAGEPGTGKTRLVEACTTEMLSQGVRVITLAGNVPDGLRVLFERLLCLRPLSPAERAKHRFLLTVLGVAAHPGSLREISELDLEAIRSRAFHEGLQLLSSSGQQQTVFVIEDADCADPRMLDFLRRLARSNGGEPSAAGVLATTRSLEALFGSARDDGGSEEGPNGVGPSMNASRRRSAHLEGAAPSAPPLDTVRVVRLGSMGRREVIELIRSIDPDRGAGEAAEIARSSEGNPGRIVERLRALQPGEARALADLTPQEMLFERARALDEKTSAVLLHLSLLERPAGETLLAKITGQILPEIRAAKARLDAAGLAKGSAAALEAHRSLGGAPLSWGVAPDRVRAAHERIGLIILREPRRQHEAARHLLRAGWIDEGLAAAERGGAELGAGGRVEEALAAYQEALQYASVPATALRLLEAAGDLSQKSGMFDEAARCYRRAMDCPELPGVARLRLLRKLGGVHQRRGENEAARAVFEEALPLLDGIGDVEEHLYLFQELSALYLFRGDYARAATLANRGLEILASERAGGLAEEARSLHALNFHAASGHILLRHYEFDGAAREFERGLVFARKIASLSSTALLLNNLGIAYSQANRLREALRVYTRAASVAKRMEDAAALFSIGCNVATIRARLGELVTAGEILGQTAERSAPGRSRRAELFLLHTRALVDRLALADARDLWLKAVGIADDLPDPLFAGHGRVYLLENEIQLGRWASARRVLQELEPLREKDARLDRAAGARQAYLDALCGRMDEARSAIDAARSHGPDAYSDLWDDLYRAAALIELEESAGADVILRRADKVFRKSRQWPSALECALLLADNNLRAGRADQAAQNLHAAAAAARAHDMLRGSRNIRVRLPYLEARAILQRGAATRSRVEDCLVDAAGNLTSGSTAEIAWLIDLVAAAASRPGAKRKLVASRRKFADGLVAADRQSYLARDHEARLGLCAQPASVPASARHLAITGRRYEVLLELRCPVDPREVLEDVLEAAGVERGAVFLERPSSTAAAQGFEALRKDGLEELRRAALSAGTGRVGSGLCFELASPGRPRVGVLYAELSGPDPDPEAIKFLQAASRLLASSASAQQAKPARLAESTAVVRATQGTQVAPPSDENSASPQMRDLVAMVLRTRESQLPVLIVGESGVGKDHLARRIHALSPRSRGPFVAQDCSAVPEELFEADIFGYVEGAFTGAEQAKTGYIFAAEGGTYYLDNVDSLSLEAQAKLLRVLEEKAVRPLGGREPRKTDVRVIASSQHDLRDLSLRGEFRKDLYYRLAGICLEVPPLRERTEDIPLLWNAFARHTPGGSLEFTSEALEVLKSHAWPGNVRELESVVRRLTLTTEGKVDAERVRQVLGLQGTRAMFPRWVFEGKSYEEAVEEVKREYLLELLERHGGDLDRIAGEMETTKRNVYFRFAQAGIKPVDLQAARAAEKPAGSMAPGGVAPARGVEARAGLNLGEE